MTALSAAPERVAVTVVVAEAAAPVVEEARWQVRTKLPPAWNYELTEVAEEGCCNTMLVAAAAVAEAAPVKVWEGLGEGVPSRPLVAVKNGTRPVQVGRVAVGPFHDVATASLLVSGECPRAVECGGDPRRRGGPRQSRIIPNDGVCGDAVPIGRVQHVLDFFDRNWRAVVDVALQTRDEVIIHELVVANGRAVDVGPIGATLPEDQSRPSPREAKVLTPRLATALCILQCSSKEDQC